MGKLFLVGRFVFFFFSFSSLSISSHDLLVYNVSAKKSAYSLMGFPLYEKSFFLAAFKNFLSLIFDNFILTYFGEVHFGLNLYENYELHIPGCVYLSLDLGSFQSLFP